jgi:hypothetical protein
MKGQQIENQRPERRASREITRGLIAAHSLLAILFFFSSICLVQNPNQFESTRIKRFEGVVSAALGSQLRNLEIQKSASPSKSLPLFGIPPKELIPPKFDSVGAAFSPTLSFFARELALCPRSRGPPAV